MRLQISRSQNQDHIVRYQSNLIFNITLVSSNVFCSTIQPKTEIYKTAYLPSGLKEIISFSPDGRQAILPKRHNPCSHLANAIRSSASISSNDGDNNDGEDWFHHTDLGTSYTSTDSRTSDIQLNTAYHKLLRDIRDRQQHGRAENRSDTAAVEQRLLVPPHVQHTHTRQRNVLLSKSVLIII